MPNFIDDQVIIEDGTFHSEMDGKSHVFFKHYIPKKLSKKKLPVHIIFQHGMIEYHQRHFPLFESLFNAFENEVIISTMDLVGHGQSGGHRAYVTDFKYFRKDWVKFLEICQQKFQFEDESQHIVISHSLGGLIVLGTLMDEDLELPFKISATVFSNPCISPKLKLPVQLEERLERLNEFFSKVRVPLIYDAYDLTHDNERAIDFIRDPLISKAVTLKLAAETVKSTKNIIRHSYFFDYDSFFILSGDDRVVDCEKTRLFVTGMDKNKVKLSEYPNMCHDILNETCRNDVFQEIIDYIKLRIKKSK